MNNNYIITDRAAIIKAMCMPKSLPESFKLAPLVPIGMSKFKGDHMPTGWSVNDQFEKGKSYPVYEGENGMYVIGKDGIGKKFLKSAWTNVRNL